MRSNLAARFWYIAMGAPRGHAVRRQLRVRQHHVRPPRKTETLRCDLFAVNRNLARRFNADANLIAINLAHRDPDVLADDDFSPSFLLRTSMTFSRLTI